MEPLFQTTLTCNGQATAYEIHFENEEYVFQAPEGNAPVIRLKREDDEWHSTAGLAESLKAAAISELDRYLLAQH